MLLQLLESARTPAFVRWLFPLITWSKPRSCRSVYLTFDDGPTPGATNAILDELNKANGKATFFCVGKAMLEAPDIVSRMLQEGHAIGNHTFSHLAGWSSSVRGYLADIARCDQVIASHAVRPFRPFRPPYAKLGIIQGLRLLRERPVVLWDVNSMDYRPEQTPNQIARRVIQQMRPGSIVLMHDSKDSGGRTLEALPTILRAIQEREWSMDTL